MLRNLLEASVMTEREWRESASVLLMMAEVREQATCRQWRLFASGCIRELGHLLAEAPARQAFLIAERFADDDATPAELANANGKAEVAFRHLFTPNFRASHTFDVRSFDKMVCVQAALIELTRADTAEKIAEAVTLALRSRAGHDPEWLKRLEQLQCHMLRELFGPALPPPALSRHWLDGVGRQAVEVARAIYTDRHFDELPVLGDALIDCDCPHEAMIAHCQKSGYHGRGCWVVDALRA